MERFQKQEQTHLKFYDFISMCFAIYLKASQA